MALTREDRLVVDYQASLELLKNEDARKSHLFTVFFLIQGAILLAFSSALDRLNLGGAVAFPVLGVVLGGFWYLVMERIQGFVELHYAHLKHLESCLEDITTITNEEALRATGTVSYGDVFYSLSRRRNLFSISKALEVRLPLAIASMWLIALLAVWVGLFGDFELSR